MYKNFSFNEETDPFSLRFKNPKHEARFRSHKEYLISNFSQNAILLIYLSMTTITFLIRYFNEASQGNDQQKNAALASLLVGDLPIIIEVIIQHIKPLRCFRFFFCSVAISLSAIIYDSYVFQYPCIFLSGACNYLFVVIVNSEYGYNWFFSGIIQIICQISMTLFYILRHSGNYNDINFLLPIISFNIVSIPAIWIYYVHEREKRLFIYCAWEKRKEAKFWNKLISTLPLGLIIAREGEILYWNKFTNNIFEDKIDGQDALQLCLKKVYMVGQENTTLHDIMLKTQGCNENFNAKFSFKTLCSEDVHISVTVHNFKRSGKIYKVCNFQNEKVQEELEQERMRSKYQKNFFAMMTHELRNPLNGIMGILDIIKNSLKTNELLQYCTIGLNTGKLMMCLVNDILDISQLEANKLTLVEETQNFYRAAEECIEIMKVQYDQKGLYLQLNTLSALPLICNDRRRYTQILINLLSNAMKFTKKGGVKIDMLYEMEKNELQTSVTDTGIGIEENDINKLFEMYGKLDRKKKILRVSD